MGAGNTTNSAAAPVGEIKIHSVESPSGTMYYRPTSIQGATSNSQIKSLYLPHISKDAENALLVIQPTGSQDIYFIEQVEESDTMVEEGGNSD